MSLKNLVAQDRTIKVDHPYLEGLVVEFSYIPREEVKKLMKRATTQTFDRKTHQPVEELDESLFTELYVKQVIKGWSGFKYNYLKELMAVDFSDFEGDLDSELPYTEEDALILMKNSPDFDTWVTSVTGDIKNFNKSN